MALRFSRAFLAWTERDAYLVAIGAMYAIVLVWLLPFEVVQDSWLTLVGGREIAANGLPTQDSLTVMTDGARWIEQQWAARLGFYALVQAGGLNLALMVHAAVLVGAFAGAMAAARSFGASRTAVFWTAAATMFVAPWAWQMRSQTFAFPLFVAVTWLLVSDARSPSRRVLLVFPLLAVWANVHGSVVLAAVLVVLRSLTMLPGALRRRDRSENLRLLVLLVGPAACVLASPYGLSLVDYYRSLILNDAIGRYVVEWAPSAFPRDWAIFALAGVTIWLAARSRGATAFEKLVLLATMASALMAVRNAVWFSLCALVVLPAFADELWRLRRFEGPVRTRAVVWLARTNVVVLVAAVVVTVALERDVARRFPATAAHEVAEAAAADPSLRVLASDRYADWLLWREPQLAGRVAYDVRFEMLTPAQIGQIAAFEARLGPNWKRFANGYRLLVIDRRANPEIERAFRREPGAQLLYRDAALSVVLRTRAASKAAGPARLRG